MKVLLHFAARAVLVAAICQPAALLAQCPDWQSNGTQPTTVTNCTLLIRLNDAFGLQFKKADGTPGGVAGLDHNNALILKGTGGGVIIRDSANASDRLTIREDGKVGIGTDLNYLADPATLLDVNNAIRARVNNAFGLQFNKSDGTAGGVAGLDSDNALILKGSGGGLKVRDTTNTNTLIFIKDDGHVGIGPGVDVSTYTLNVAGTLHATQIIGATYQDVAEWVPATAKMSPGTVVVVQRGANNTVMPSATAYATTVAGVVSEKPGVILGESSDSKAMIATTGRVKVHVDARAGAIEAGDLLVTSGKPGVAMKSQPVDFGGIKIHRPGTLIGKALESLPDGEGDILVLLSLQ
jgi:hypothetical protein